MTGDKETPMTTKSSEAPNGTAKRRKPAAKKTVVAPPAPSREEIARLAERGWPEGSAEQDWLRAEQELKTAS
jgi:hypothetical protein